MTWLYNDLQRLIIQRLYDVAKTEYQQPLNSLDVNYFLRLNNVVLMNELTKNAELIDELIHEFMKGMTLNEETNRSSDGPLWKL